MKLAATSRNQILIDGDRMGSNPRPAFQCRLSTALAELLLFGLAVNVAGAQPSLPAIQKSTQLSKLRPTDASPTDASPTDANTLLSGPALAKSPTWSEVLRAVLLTAIPNTYEDLSHWGKTVEVFDGVDIRQRGFDIRMKERKKPVNHGAWHRYKIELIDPANRLKLVIDRIHPTGMGQFRFDIRFASSLRCRADFENWLFGVKGFNMTAVSEADIQVVAHCHLAIHTEPNRKSIFPDLVLEPKVTGINLSLSNLDVRRIGEIRGDIAEGIGDASRRMIENLLQSQEARVLKKANEAIDKKRSSLRISATPF